MRAQLPCHALIGGGGSANRVRPIGGGSAHCVHNAYKGGEGVKKGQKSAYVIKVCSQLG